ncbi:NADH-quinone oxidoreductase subunit NuoN [Sanguibacter sp. A247]|uniref:NADH-quinone oxidoreductase subunit NuoN n=1 Tax=unclassified Sanguibacter TaxID=2645534 RepID=UPI003FD7DC2F
MTPLVAAAPQFTQPEISWQWLAPYILVLGAGVIAVLVEAFVPPRARRTTQLTLALAAVLGATGWNVWLWVTELAPTTFKAQQVVGGSLMVTYFTLALQTVLLVVAAIALLVIADRSRGADDFAPTAAATPGSDYEELARKKDVQQTEIYPLFLFAVGGMILFPAAGDLLTMFIALEILSLPLYVMSGMARHRRLLSQEASLKYFLLGAFSSAFFLMGMALVYGYAGTINLWAITAGHATSVPTDLVGGRPLLVAGIVMLLVGVLFKVGAVPFHQWTPDVYQGAPTSISGFMAACTKAAAFGAALRIVLWTAPFIGLDLHDEVQLTIIIVAIASMLVGSVLGVVQHDVKRLLAYSSIAHAGFVLVAVAAVKPFDGAEFTFPMNSAIVFYLLAYGLATVGAFAVVRLVRESQGRGSDLVTLGEATHLSQWAGLARRSPFLAVAFSVFLLSFAGIPLTAGFVGKFAAFKVAVDSGLWWLAMVAVVGSAISVFFYVRIIVLMFFVDPATDDGEHAPVREVVAVGALGATSDAPVGTPLAGEPEAGVGLRLSEEMRRTTAGVAVLRGSVGSRVAIAVTMVGTLLLGVLPGPVLDLLEKTVSFLP